MLTAKRASVGKDRRAWAGLLSVCEHWLQEHKPWHASPAYLSDEQKGPLEEILYDPERRAKRDSYHYDDKGKGSKGKRDEDRPEKGSGKRRRKSH